MIGYVFMVLYYEPFYQQEQSDFNLHWWFQCIMHWYFEYV